MFARIMVLCAVTGLTAGCASERFPEVVSDNHSLVVVSFSRTYKFQNSMGALPPFITVAAPDEKEAKGRIVGTAGFRAPVRDGETWRITRMFSIEGTDYIGAVNLIRAPAGQYSLREWIAPERRISHLGAVGDAMSVSEKRGPLDTPFKIRPDAIVYLGNVHLDEGVVVTRADCRDRDLRILKAAFPDAPSERIQYEPLGDAKCPE